MPVLCFTIDPADLPRLRRWPGLRISRSFPVETRWHDTPDHALREDGLALSETGATWSLARTRAEGPAQPPATVATARSRALLGRPVPDDLQPVAGFVGRRQALRWSGEAGSVEGRLLEGAMGAGPLPDVCSLTLEGEAAAVRALAQGLAAAIGLSVPRWSVAEQALAGAAGALPAPRALGAPEVAKGQSVAESLAVIIGHLVDVMVHWAGVLPTARTPEAVHQMRVATRRLRSALSVFKPVAACPELAGVTAPLRICAARLGTARDWDVFIGGLGAQLAAAFPDDPRCAAMMRAASQRRRAAYAELRAFVAGPDFRSLAVALAGLAALQPWHGAAAPEGLAEDTAVFAAGVLTRRMRRVRKDGRGIDTLPVPALHELRKDCKRLRYAAEFFSPLFPAKAAKRFLARLSALQEELGLLNDGAAVSGLMAQLGRLERSYAAGLVEGFSAAHAGPARERIVADWERFRAARLFWPR